MSKLSDQLNQGIQEGWIEPPHVPKSRADFMTEQQKKMMGNLPRTHKNCVERTKVARPGKTAHDRAKREGKI